MALEFLVRNQRLKLFSGGPVVADSQQYLKARFTFSEDWQGTRKYAQFRRDGEVYTCVIDEYGETEVPWETLVGKGVVQISAFATNQQDEENKLITTNPVFVKVETSGIKETELPKTPSLGILGSYVDESLKEITDTSNQLILQMTEIRDRVLQAEEHIDQTDYKIYVGESEPTEEETNAVVWINPAEDDGGSDELAEAVAGAQNAATKAENMVATLPENWQDTVDYAALAKIKTDGVVTPQMFKTDNNSWDNAIQQAIDSGKLVFIPSGTYSITSNIIIRDNTRIIGSSWKESILEMNGHIISIAGKNTNDNTDSGYKRFVSLDNVFVRGDETQDLLLDCSFSKNIEISKCTFSRAKRIIKLQGTWDSVIKDCYFINCGSNTNELNGIIDILSDDGFYCTNNVRFIRCTWETFEGSAVYSDSKYTYNLTFDNCKMETFLSTLPIIYAHENGNIRFNNLAMVCSIATAVNRIWLNDCYMATVDGHVFLGKSGEVFAGELPIRVSGNNIVLRLRVTQQPNTDFTQKPLSSCIGYCEMTPYVRLWNSLAMMPKLRSIINDIDNANYENPPAISSPTINVSGTYTPEYKSKIRIRWNGANGDRLKIEYGNKRECLQGIGVGTNGTMNYSIYITVNAGETITFTNTGNVAVYLDVCPTV